MSFSRKHVLMVSPPFYGHALPLLELARKISHVHRVTFAVSKTILKNVEKSFENEDEKGNAVVTFVGMEDGMTPAEADLNLSSMRIVFNFILPSARQFFRSLRSTKNQEKPTSKENSIGPVDVVICDNFLGGPAAICHEEKIPYYLFSSASGWLLQCFLTLDIAEPEDFNVEMKNSPFNRPSIGEKFLNPNMESNKDLLLEIGQTVHLADGLIFNGPHLIEEEALRHIGQFPSVARLKKFCIGPLIPEKEGICQRSEQKTTNFFVKKWLNSKKPSSVLYVAFGSIVMPAPEQLAQLGKALLALAQPFIWSLRANQHRHLPEEMQGCLEENPPFLILPWLPQKDILSHSATAVFLSHCGWNSTLESLVFGVPVVGWPMFSDQLQNALWLEEKGIGKCLRGTGNRLARLLSAEEIVEILRDVGGWKSLTEGHTQSTYKRCADRWAAMIKDAVGPNGSSTTDLLQLLKFEEKNSE